MERRYRAPCGPSRSTASGTRGELLDGDISLASRADVYVITGVEPTETLMATIDKNRYCDLLGLRRVGCRDRACAMPCQVIDASAASESNASFT